MKRTKKILMLLSMIILLTGCSMKAEYKMEIKEDKSMDFSIIMAMDDELIEGFLSMEKTTSETAEQEEFTEAEKWQIVDDMFEDDDEDAGEGEEPKKSVEEYGFTKEKYEVDGYKGYRLVKKINNIDEISGEKANFELENFEEISDKIVFEKSGNKYKAKFVLKNENEESASGAEVMFDIKFIVTLPQEPISHNADEISEDKKTLTWNLLDENSQNIDFEFMVEENNTMLIIGIAVFAVGLLSVILVVVKSAKTKKKKEIPQVETQMQEQQIQM